MRAPQPKLSDVARLDGPTEPRFANNADLELNLVTLLESAGWATRAAGAALWPKMASTNANRSDLEPSLPLCTDARKLLCR